MKAYGYQLVVDLLEQKGAEGSLSELYRRFIAEVFFNPLIYEFKFAAYKRSQYTIYAV
jgi:hypothetical protein